MSATNVYDKNPLIEMNDLCITEVNLQIQYNQLLVENDKLMTEEFNVLDELAWLRMDNEHNPDSIEFKNLETKQKEIEEKLDINRRLLQECDESIQYYQEQINLLSDMYYNNNN